MPLRTNDFQAAQFCHAFAQLNIRTTASHVGRNRNRTHLTGQCNNFRFLRMIFRIQHLMFHALALEQPAQFLRFVNRNRTNQNRLSLFMRLQNVLYHSAELARLCPVNHIL